MGSAISRQDDASAAMVLVGGSPAMIQWGGSLRAWGFGVLMMLLMVGAVQRMLRRPTAVRVAIAGVASVLAVQAVYYNAVILAALCCGAVAVGLRDRRWKPTMILIGIAVLSAASLLPYVALIRRANTWRLVDKGSLGLVESVEAFVRAINMAGAWCAWLWLLMMCAAGGVLIVKRNRAGVFMLVASVTGVAGYMALIRYVAITSSAWYYLVIMAFLVVVADAAVARDVRLRWARIVLVIVAVGLGGEQVWTAAHTSQSNIRMITMNLSRDVTDSDLIVITPWWLGMSFDRYYAGDAPWCTLPQLSDHRSYRADLAKQRMMQASPIQDVLTRVESTLRGGGRVVVLGFFEHLKAGQQPQILPPAPHSIYGWSERAYVMSWMEQLMLFIDQHAQRLTGIRLDQSHPVNDYEQAGLFFAQGWGETSPQRNRPKAPRHDEHDP